MKKGLVLAALLAAIIFCCFSVVEGESNKYSIFDSFLVGKEKDIDDSKTRAAYKYSIVEKEIPSKEALFEQETETLCEYANKSVEIEIDNRDYNGMSGDNSGSYEQSDIYDTGYIENCSDTGSVYTYLGDWCCTAYCSCPICCGEYSSGYTASGTLATAYHTAASNILPFGAQIEIEGIVYTIEDTGYSPYGDEWIDIYFDSHEEALAFGIRYLPVYLIE